MKNLPNYVLFAIFDEIELEIFVSISKFRATVTSCCVCIDEWSLCLLHNEFFHSYYYRFYFSIFSNIVLYNKKLIFNNDWTDVCSLMINLKVHKCTKCA